MQGWSTPQIPADLRDWGLPLLMEAAASVNDPSDGSRLRAPDRGFRARWGPTSKAVKQNDAVLGSGMPLIAAQKTGRRGYYIEIDPAQSGDCALYAAWRPF